MLINVLTSKDAVSKEREMGEVLYSSLQQSCPVLSNPLSVRNRMIAHGTYAALIAKIVTRQIKQTFIFFR